MACFLCESRESAQLWELQCKIGEAQVQTLMPMDSISISYVLCRVLKALKQRLDDTIAEKKASQNFTIKGAGDIPKTMQVKQSPVMQNGNGKA